MSDFRFIQVRIEAPKWLGKAFLLVRHRRAQRLRAKKEEARHCRGGPAPRPATTAAKEVSGGHPVVVSASG